MQTTYSNQTQRKLSEFRTLTNRLNRYWKFLVRESLQKAQERGLEVRAVESNVHLSSDIIVKREGDSVDVSELIGLVRNDYRSLHRRYEEGLAKHEKLFYELREFLN